MENLRRSQAPQSYVGDLQKAQDLESPVGYEDSGERFKELLNKVKDRIIGGLPSNSQQQPQDQQMQIIDYTGDLTGTPGAVIPIEEVVPSAKEGSRVFEYIPTANPFTAEEVKARANELWIAGLKTLASPDELAITELPEFDPSIQLIDLNEAGVE